MTEKERLEKKKAEIEKRLAQAEAEAKKYEAARARKLKETLALEDVKREIAALDRRGLTGTCWALREGAEPIDGATKFMVTRIIGERLAGCVCVVEKEDGSPEGWPRLAVAEMPLRLWASARRDGADGTAQRPSIDGYERIGRDAFENAALAAMRALLDKAAAAGADGENPRRAGAAGEDAERGRET